jgi:hypothetical protein
MRDDSSRTKGSTRRAGLAALTALAALACGASRLVRVEHFTDERFPSKETPLDVAVLNARPTADHREIARLEGGGHEFEEVSQVLGRLREEAAWLGADAIVVLQSGYRFEPHPRVGVHQPYLYGYPDPPLTLGDPADPGAYALPYASAIAIRFVQTPTKPVR